MTYVIVAADTVEIFVVRYTVRNNFTHIIPVAVQAVRIQNSGISRLNANRFAKIP